MAHRPHDWQLAYDGRLVAAHDDDDATELVFELPRLERTAAIRLVGRDRFEWRPSTHTWEDDDIVDPAVIADAGLTVDGARWSRDRSKVVISTSDGTILAAYASLEADAELADAWRSYWAGWREAFDEPVHPQVREWLVNGAGAPVSALLETWRDERTSDLAALIDVLDEPKSPVTLASLEDFDRWARACRESPVGSARELARCASWTMEPWLDDRDSAAAWWEGLTGAIARVDTDPDPRIAHALIASLYSPSDWWFRVDQVAHVAGPFESPSADPSFADHLFERLDVHAGAGAPELALEVRDAVLVECDCNGAEMGERLRRFADRVRARYPRDRPLSRDAREAASWRTRA